MAIHSEAALSAVLTRFPIRRWMGPQASAKSYFSLKVRQWSGCQSSQSAGLRCDSGLQICFCFRCRGKRRLRTNNAWRQSHTCHPSASDISVKGEENQVPASDFRYSFAWGKTAVTAPLKGWSSSAKLTSPWRLFRVDVKCLGLRLLYSLSLRKLMDVNNTHMRARTSGGTSDSAINLIKGDLHTLQEFSSCKSATSWKYHLKNRLASNTSVNVYSSSAIDCFIPATVKREDQSFCTVVHHLYSLFLIRFKQPPWNTTCGNMNNHHDRVFLLSLKMEAHAYSEYCENVFLKILIAFIIPVIGEYKAMFKFCPACVWHDRMCCSECGNRRMHPECRQGPLFYQAPAFYCCNNGNFDALKVSRRRKLKRWVWTLLVSVCLPGSC